MKAADTPWRTTALRLMAQRGLSARALARMIGENERSVRHWLYEGRSPHQETRKIAAIATVLNVPVAWLHDPTPEPPPKGAIPPDVLDAVPKPARRLIYAAFDPATLEYLVRMLDEYDRARSRGPEPEPEPRRRTRGRSTHD